MAFQKIEFEFPDDAGDEIEVESSSAEPMDKAEPKKEEKPEPKKEEEEAELDIEVVDDTPVEDRNRKKGEPPEEVTDEELEGYSDKVRKRINHLSKGYHDERREKEQALRERQELEAYARKLMEENNNLKGSVGKTQTSLLEQAKRSVVRDLEEAKREYREAYEAGNAEAVLEAQDKLTTARIRADKIGNIKLPPLQEEVTDVKSIQRGADEPVQGQAPKQPQVDSKAAKWAEENTWFGTDDEMTSFALGYHQKLVKSGVNPSSEDYYAKINSRMRQVFPENFEDTEEGDSKEQSTKRSSNVVAPATRSAAPKKVRLTQTQVAIAKKLGVPLELYAKQVADDMRKQNG